VTRPTRPSVVTRLSDYGVLVEVGVGRRPGLAAALVERGCRVTATDVVDRATPPGVHFVRDDVTDPDRSVYAGADAVYMRRCPPELQGPLADVARSVGADCLFTTLGGDPTVVAVDRETVAEGTLFSARTTGPDSATPGGQGGGRR
jgi:hypothetical protein